MKAIYILSISLMLLLPFSAWAQTKEEIFKAAGTPAHTKVNVSWNRYYTSDGLAGIGKKIADAHPGLVKRQSIGKSYEGRDIWCLTITDFGQGKESEKPAFYIDGNIHSNEIQGSEIALYTAWFLTESHPDNKFVRKLLAEKVFYIVPTINPDARDHYMKEANTPHSPRSGMITVDNDKDGLFGEDGPNDLNGDGHITYMRRKSPFGRYRADPSFPNRMIEVGPDEFGEYELLGYEGIDDDGDGMVNEDSPQGYYDPNRDWGWSWQPGHIQRGAYKYPFSLPENRAVMEFVMAHPNIAGAQTYHNYGGMILRGPGAEEDRGTYNRTDDRVYDAIGNLGEKIMPGYKYMVVWRDLYSVFGGELDWFHGGRGIFTFTNELYTSYMMFDKKYEGWSGGQEDQYLFDKHLLMEDAFVDWAPYDHPQYGEIEIGGTKKNFSRANPGFLLESDAHRNMAFTLYHAYHTPKLSIHRVEEKDLGGGIKEITATIANERLIPTHSSHDLKYKITPPDLVTIEGAEVIAGILVENPDLNLTKEQEHQAETLKVANIPGMGTVTVRWIVSGGKNYTITVISEKGGKAVYKK